MKRIATAVVLATALATSACGGTVDTAESQSPVPDTSSAGVADTSTDASADTDAAEQGGAVETTSCEELIPDVISITEDDTVGSRILSIYRPVTVADKTQAFSEGEVTIPAGENQVEILTCSGEALFDDAGEEVPITYGMLIDSNDEIFVRYNVV